MSVGRTAVLLALTALEALGAAGAVSLTGCAAPAPGDAGAEPDGGAVTFPPLPVVTNGTPSEPTREIANYGCLGAATAPTPGPAITYRMELRGFGSGDPVANARVYVFPDGVPSLSCTGRCVDVMTDLAGNATVTGPAGAWLALGVFPRPGATMASTYVASHEVNVAAPRSTDGTVRATAVSISALNSLLPPCGFGGCEPSTFVTGRVRDCDGEPVRGAVVRVFGADGREHLSTPEVLDTAYFWYFDGDESPDGSATFTSVDGLFAALNLPAAGPDALEALRVEAGRRRRRHRAAAPRV